MNAENSCASRRKLTVAATASSCRVPAQVTLQRRSLKFWRTTEPRRFNPKSFQSWNSLGRAVETPAITLSGLSGRAPTDGSLTPKLVELLWRVRRPKLGRVPQSWSQNENPSVAKEFAAQK